MSRTYRALAIVAVVATLLSVASTLWYIHVTVSWFSDSPFGGPAILGLPANIFLAFWAPTNTLAGPVVGVFSVVVAAQARRRGWIAVFILFGLFAVYGQIPLAYLEAYSGLARQLRTIGLDAIAPQLLPLVLLAIATLIFVASARSRQPTDGIERTALL